MTEAKIRLYKFLVKMERMTKKEYEEVVGMVYEE